MRRHARAARLNRPSPNGRLHRAAGLCFISIRDCRRHDYQTTPTASSSYGAHRSRLRQVGVSRRLRPNRGETLMAAGFVKLAKNAALTGPSRRTREHLLIRRRAPVIVVYAATALAASNCVVQTTNAWKSRCSLAATIPGNIWRFAAPKRASATTCAGCGTRSHRHSAMMCERRAAWRDVCTCNGSSRSHEEARRSRQTSGQEFLRIFVPLRVFVKDRWQNRAIAHRFDHCNPRISIDDDSTAAGAAGRSARRHRRCPAPSAGASTSEPILQRRADRAPHIAVRLHSSRLKAPMAFLRVL